MMAPPPASAPTSLYVHVPFCVSKCAYCDFASVAGAGEETQRAYAATLLEHARSWAEAGAFDRGVVSVYFGGGTPTLLGDRLTELVAEIRGLLGRGLASGAEITVETNPETTDMQFVDDLVAVGVNRFSLGVQSFDDTVLRYLGRCHDSATAARAARILAEAGVSFSADLICGIPGMSEASWRDSLTRVIETGADHVSVYPLMIEDDTPLGARVLTGETEPSADRAADDMMRAEEVLGDAGIERYEVANYARPGAESVHNSGYWTGRPYVGLGPSAAGMFMDGTVRTRYVYPRDLDAWTNGGVFDFAECDRLGLEDVAREDVMLGLRLAAGVPDAQVRAASIRQVLGALAEKGLVELAGASSADEGRWRTTRRGWLLGNEVFSAVLFD